MFLFRRGFGRLALEQAHACDAVLLDVREAAEWRAGHAPGAIHLPLTRVLTGAALPDTVRGRPVTAICCSGHRSQQAAKLLAFHGVDAVDVTGGMTARTGAGLPVVGEGEQDGRTA
ncbi:rhodanese-like domain-containing protein [Streptomyces sp. BRA346]|uniref:rhodanese-like domain-containing protein n=1 Tax=Streptomyces sp. BRA346 TaxID=2878199 RepID=UPI0040633A58